MKWQHLYVAHGLSKCFVSGLTTVHAVMYVISLTGAPYAFNLITMQEAINVINVDRLRTVFRSERPCGFSVGGQTHCS